MLVHAELNALFEADKLKSEVPGNKEIDLFTSVPDRKKMALFTSLEPCLMCYGAAMSAYIGEIYFSLKAPEDGALSLIRFEKFNNDYLKFQNPKVEGNILSEQAKELWVEYMKKYEEGSFWHNFSKGIIDSN